MSARARRWSAVGPFLRVAGLGCLLAMAAPAAAGAAVRFALWDLMCFQMVRSFLLTAYRAACLPKAAGAPRELLSHDHGLNGRSFTLDSSSASQYRIM